MSSTDCAAPALHPQTKASSHTCTAKTSTRSPSIRIDQRPQQFCCGCARSVGDGPSFGAMPGSMAVLQAQAFCGVASADSCDLLRGFLTKPTKPQNFTDLENESFAIALLSRHLLKPVNKRSDIDIPPARCSRARLLGRSRCGGSDPPPAFEGLEGFVGALLQFLLPGFLGLWGRAQDLS